jgi:hypothetical protein
MFDLIISFLYSSDIQRYTNLQKKKNIFICFLKKIKEFKKIRKGVAIDSNKSRNRPVGHPWDILLYRIHRRLRASYSYI